MSQIHDNRILSYTVDLGNEWIVFDIEAASLEDFIEDNRDLLGQKKRYGWPLAETMEIEVTDVSAA